MLISGSFFRIKMCFLLGYIYLLLLFLIFVVVILTLLIIHLLVYSFQTMLQFYQGSSSCLFVFVYNVLDFTYIYSKFHYYFPKSYIFMFEYSFGCSFYYFYLQANNVSIQFKFSLRPIFSNSSKTANFIQIRESLCPSLCKF